MTDITPEILSRLDALAAKLNVTGTHLWELLIKQATINGIQDIIGIVITFVMFLASICLFKFLMKKHEVAKDKIHYDSGYLIGANVILFLCILIFLVTLSLNGSSCINSFFNPEYTALYEILRAIK